MKKSLLAGSFAVFVLTGAANAADLAERFYAVPSPPLVWTWTGFYGGIQIGGGWSNESVNFSPNDPLAAQIINGTEGFLGEQPLATSQRISQSGAVGGFEAGYNWQAGANWLLGLETDFSFSGMSGHASSTSILIGATTPPITQVTTANESTDWYGTLRGRAGWLVTPNLLLFGTGGFAYGRVAGSANYTPGDSFGALQGIISFECTANLVCFSGSSSEIRTGWTAGGGVEWLFDRHWSAKIEYQFVDLGTETVPIRAVSLCTLCMGASTTLSSFNATFHDQFNVVRAGLNYRF